MSLNLTFTGFPNSKYTYAPLLVSVGTLQLKDYYLDLLKPSTQQICHSEKTLLLQPFPPLVPDPRRTWNKTRDV